MNCFSFCISENVFILPLFIDTVSCYRIQVDIFFFFLLVFKEILSSHLRSFPEEI